ncbi:oligosaccharide flippase family protein, partial [Patescibacteria group bacterium]
MKRSHVLLKNISSNFFAQFWLMLVSFLATPIIFKKLGSSQYGLLILLNTIPAFLSVLDFGLIASLIKNISGSKTNNSKLSSLISTALIFFSILMIFWGGIVFSFSRILVYKILKVPPELTNIAIISLKLISVSFIFSSLTTFFSAIPQSLQRFEIYNLKNLLIGTILPIGSIVLILNNKGIIDIVSLYIIVHVFTLIIFYLIAKKLLPDFRFTFKITKNDAKKLLSFGGFKFISNINARIVFQLNQFLIAAFLPIGLVSFYAIPSTLAQKVSGILPNITSPVFPLSSELSSLKLKEKLQRLYVQTVKLSNLIMMPLMLFIFFFSHSILSLWINTDFANNASLVLKILCLAFLLASFSATPVTITEGLGKPKITAFFSTLSVFLYLFFALILIPKYGILGAALSVLLNRIIQIPIFLYYITSKIIHLKSLKFYTQNYLKIFFIAVISLVTLIPLQKHITSLFNLLLIALLYSLI